MLFAVFRLDNCKSQNWSEYACAAIYSSILQLIRSLQLIRYLNKICAYLKMPSRCSAPRCTNSNKDGYCCVTFAQDLKLRKKWIDAIGISDWKPSKSAVLCEVHFHSSELFRIGNKKIIRKGAIPSLFCKCNESVKLKRRRTFKQINNNKSQYEPTQVIRV